MSEIRLAGRAFAAVLRRDVAIFLSYRTRLVSQSLSALFSLALPLGGAPAE